MGDIYRVALTYAEADKNGPGSVVVKLPSSFEENRAQGVALGMFEAEVRFYSELSKQTEVGLPRVYLAEINSGTAEFVIVMEDLSAMEMVGQAEGMTLTQAYAAVRVLADIHAVWWDKVSEESGGEDVLWLPSMVGPRIEFVNQLLPQLLPVFLAGFAEYLPPGRVELYEKFSTRYLAVNKVIAARSPWTLVHQDFRVENMLFDASGGERVVVIDWQGIGRGPGAYDLAYLLGGSMTETLRRDHERALVGAYHERLLSRGIEGFSVNQLWEDY